MTNTKQKHTQWLIALFVLFFLLFSFPMLSIFEKPEVNTAHAFVYIFVVWLVLIVSMKILHHTYKDKP